MGQHAQRVYVRLTADEKGRLRELSSQLGLSMSDVVRVLLQLPVGFATGGARPLEPVLFDRESVAHLRREMRRWGHHYNQAVHALNAIAYYLRLGDADAADALDGLARVSDEIGWMNEGVSQLRAEVGDLTQRYFARV